MDVELVDLRDFDLPLFDEVASNAWVPSADPRALAWQKKMAEFDGYIFVVAEYNRSITGALKNALDQAYVEWARKPMGAIAYGSMGGARALEHLRTIAVELQMVPIRTCRAHRRCAISSRSTRLGRERADQRDRGEPCGFGEVDAGRYRLVGKRHDGGEGQGHKAPVGVSRAAASAHPDEFVRLSRGLRGGLCVLAASGRARAGLPALPSPRPASLSPWPRRPASANAATSDSKRIALQGGLLRSGVVDEPLMLPSGPNRRPAQVAKRCRSAYPGIQRTRPEGRRAGRM